MTEQNVANEENGPPKQFVRIGVVTLPVLSFKKRTTAYVKAMSPMRSQTSKDQQGKERTVNTMRVTDLETGELCNLVVPSVMSSILNREYPEAAYVNKCFEVTATKREDKQYKDITMYEIKEPGIEEPK